MGGGEPKTTLMLRGDDKEKMARHHKRIDEEIADVGQMVASETCRARATNSPHSEHASISVSDAMSVGDGTEATRPTRKERGSHEPWIQGSQANITTPESLCSAESYLSRGNSTRCVLSMSR